MTTSIDIPHGIPNLHTAGEFVDYITNRYAEEGRQMMFHLCQYHSEAEWLEGRQGHIGASQVGTVLGLTDQWKTRRQLFEEMTGKRVNEFRGNEYTKRGQSEEPLIRALWAIEHPDYDVYDGTHLIFISATEPWRSCSLDFIAVRRATGEIVIGEIKTGVWSKHWAGGSLPDNYLAQISQQLDITQFDGAVVVARLLSAGGMEAADSSGSERAYYFGATNPAVRDNMRYVRNEVADFWRMVLKGQYQPKINLAI